MFPTIPRSTTSDEEKKQEEEGEWSASTRTPAAVAAAAPDSTLHKQERVAASVETDITATTPAAQVNNPNPNASLAMTPTRRHSIQSIFMLPEESTMTNIKTPPQPHQQQHHQQQQHQQQHQRHGLLKAMLESSHMKARFSSTPLVGETVSLLLPTTATALSNTSALAKDETLPMDSEEARSTHPGPIRHMNTILSESMYSTTSAMMNSPLEFGEQDGYSDVDAAENELTTEATTSTVTATSALVEPAVQENDDDSANCHTMDDVHVVQPMDPPCTPQRLDRESSSYAVQSILLGSLTTPEKDYLESLLREGNASSIQLARQRLNDATLFPVVHLFGESDRTDPNQHPGQSSPMITLPASLSDDNAISKHQGTNTGMGQTPVVSAGNDDTHCDDFAATATTTAAMAEPMADDVIRRRAVVRDFELQRELFRLHETQFVPPSHALLRMTWAAEYQQQQQRTNNPIPAEASSPETGPVMAREQDDGNSSNNQWLLQQGQARHMHQPNQYTSPPFAIMDESTNSILSISNASRRRQPEWNDHAPPLVQTHPSADTAHMRNAHRDTEDELPSVDQEEVDYAVMNMHDWNPFKDISSWLDGSEGVEVTDGGIPMPSLPSRIPGGTTDPHDDEDQVTNRAAVGADEPPPSSSLLSPSSDGAELGTADANTEANVGEVASSAATTSNYALRSSQLSNLSNNKAPFRILGTSADDVSCHPHVLSPPLMESLLAFVPDAFSEHNFWLKYSLVRDGASLWTLLKQTRASTHTFLAIETTEGHVFGSFTCQTWRLAQGWYGSSKESCTFLWKMRRSRLETMPRSIVQQAYQESEIQVYPVRPGNRAIQYCSAKEGIMLGRGELILPRPKTATAVYPQQHHARVHFFAPHPAVAVAHSPQQPQHHHHVASPINNNSNNNNGNSAINKHYGHGLHLEANLQRGSSSNSETFGNPCLVDAEVRGARFTVANLEVWTLTPRKTVAEAEQTELSTLFLEGGREGNDSSLNLMRILVGGPI